MMRWYGASIERLTKYADVRGWICELWRSDEPLESGVSPAMAYLCLTEPGIIRGPHLHARQTDCFIFPGQAPLTLWMWKSPTLRARWRLPAGECWRVEIPPGIVHAYRNDGDRPALLINLPSQLYRGVHRQEPVDEVRYEDLQDSPYVPW